MAISAIAVPQRFIASELLQAVDYQSIAANKLGTSTLMVVSFFPILRTDCSELLHFPRQASPVTRPQRD
jgi:hypothetical protein